MQTVGTFTKPEEAHLLRMRLESAGIEAYVQDENLIQIDPFYSNAIGGVRVQVADQDVDAVKAFLAEDKGLPDAGEAQALHCPKCNSTAIERESFSKRLAYLTILFLGIPLLFIRQRLRCTHCLNTWKP